MVMKCATGPPKLMNEQGPGQKLVLIAQLKLYKYSKLGGMGWPLGPWPFAIIASHANLAGSLDINVYIYGNAL